MTEALQFLKVPLKRSNFRSRVTAARLSKAAIIREDRVMIDRSADAFDRFIKRTGASSRM